ncbi:hypothetical protein HK405_004470 [Cladochytrium tenue]|nr:hypothetical protein HK405_004470 [Cladochytrium tenue]
MTTPSATTKPAHADVAAMRQSYNLGALDDSGLPTEPLPLFAHWFEEARAALAAAGPAAGEANAACLATCGPLDEDDDDGNNDSGGGLRPTARVVLVKGFGPEGFSFYTNRRSRKSRDLAAAPMAALTFYWPALQRSVRIEGRVRDVPDVEADAYFASRPRGSQVGAWASQTQSGEVAGGRAGVDAANAEAEERFRTSESVPRPPYWGGYIVVPTRIEFWQEIQ